MRVKSRKGDVGRIRCSRQVSGVAECGCAFLSIVCMGTGWMGASCYVMHNENGYCPKLPVLPANPPANSI